MKNILTDLERKRSRNTLMVIVSFTILFILIFAMFEFVNMPSARASNRSSVSADSSGNGTVAPVAPFKKDADVWFKRMGTTKQKWIAQLPSRSELGVPVYPGAEIVVYQAGYSDKSDKLLPELGLTTSDPIKKVTAWYKKRLNGWSYNRDYNAFLPPNVKVDVMSDKFNATPHVELEHIFSKGQASGMFVNQPDNAKTLITIRYEK